MERGVGPFSKPWKLVERAESFEVQDLASRTRAFVYFSDDPWRCVSIRAPSPGRTQVRDLTPVIFTESNARAHAECGDGRLYRHAIPVGALR